MFSVLQNLLAKLCDATSRLRLTNLVHDILAGFWHLAQDLATRLTRLAELVPTDTPSTLGAHDAAAAGTGGVQFVPLEDGTIEPLLWSAQFPPAIATRLVFSDNPAGTITNSEGGGGTT
jgi:hypothetical protein